jgi:hypothetical protein
VEIGVTELANNMLVAHGFAFGGRNGRERDSPEMRIQALCIVMQVPCTRLEGQSDIHQ